MLDDGFSKGQTRGRVREFSVLFKPFPKIKSKLRRDPFSGCPRSGFALFGAPSVPSSSVAFLFYEVMQSRPSSIDKESCMMWRTTKLLVRIFLGGEFPRLCALHTVEYSTP